MSPIHCLKVQSQEKTTIFEQNSCTVHRLKHKKFRYLAYQNRIREGEKICQIRNWFDIKRILKNLAFNGECKQF